MNASEPKGHFACYRKINFRADTLDLIKHINEVIGEYDGMLTVRQLYYQFVARGYIENTDTSYDKMQDVISNGRLAGLISWTAIEDRNRNLMGLRTFASPSAAIKSVRAEYRIDKWADQRFRPEVWVEKAALEGVIGEICNQLQVDFFACRGYNSQSEQWRAGRRFARYISKGQTPIVFHLGDHDPSGLHMTEDNRERLSMFAGVPISVVRLALNMDQIHRYSPPPNPAKKRDARYADYAAKFGETSWELDALAPNVIHDLIEKAVLEVRDEKKWDAMLQQEADDKVVLDLMIEEAEGEDGNESDT